jgi:MSHA biogenesis protein MshE
MADPPRVAEPGSERGAQLRSGNPRAETARASLFGRGLVESGLVSAAQLNQALAAQRETGRMLGRTLVDLGFLDEDTLVGALARQLRVPVADLRGLRVDPELLEIVPTALAHKHRCLPLYLEASGNSRQLHLALEDPGDAVALDELRARIGIAIKPLLAAPSALDAALFRNYGATPRRAEAAQALESSAAAARARVEPEVFVKALAQLLVEKGLIGRQELAQRLELLARKG